MSQSAVLLMDNSDPGIGFRKIIADAGTGVRRPVVYQNDLHVGIILCQDALHTATESPLGIENGYDDCQLHLCKDNENLGKVVSVSRLL